MFNKHRCYGLKIRIVLSYRSITKDIVMINGKKTGQLTTNCTGDRVIALKRLSPIKLICAVLEL